MKASKSLHLVQSKKVFVFTDRSRENGKLYSYQDPITTIITSFVTTSLFC